MVQRSPLAVVLAVALCISRAPAQQLGQKVTIHLSDTVENIIRHLREEHSLWVNAEGDLYQKFVDLDLDEASPLEVISAICKQAGAVYDHYDRQNWTLRAGDWDTDCRPQTTVDEYAVYVDSIRKSHSDTVTFRWGAEAPEAQSQDGVSIRLRVEPRTSEAEAKLAGVWREASASTDTGEVVSTSFRMPPELRTQTSYDMTIMHYPQSPSLDFPPFPEGAEALAELRGGLVLFDEVIPVYGEFTPEEVGVSKALGGVDCKLVDWQVVGHEIAVTWERPLYEGEFRGERLMTTALIARDGERSGCHSWSYHRDQETFRETNRFAAADETFEKFVIQGFIRRNPHELMEFTIEDVPLP